MKINQMNRNCEIHMFEKLLRGIFLTQAVYYNKAELSRK